MVDRPDLQVLMAEGLIGVLSGGLRFTYSDEVLERCDRGTPLLSCSLPVDDRPQPASAFFDGVLPEGQHRADLAARADVTASDTYGLLVRYGRDIAGAVSIVAPDADSSRSPSVLPLSDDEFEREVAGLPERALGVHDDSELSLAGLQDKLLLVRLNGGGWGRPIAGYPSTHILKLDHQRFQGVVAAEAQCMALARSVGLTSVKTDLVTVGGIDCLIVERFDRVVEPGGIVLRLHQEDTCQALGVAPTSKYEVRHGGGGPEYTQVASLIDRYTDDPVAQLDRLAAIAAFTAVIGNADAHGKNIAFLHREPRTIELAPLYDQVPTKMWPNLEGDAAMTIGGGLNLDSINPKRVGAEAKLWRHSPSAAAAVATEVAEQVLRATTDGTIDPGSSVAEFVRNRAEQFLTT